MSLNWYFEENGERQGPVEESNIQGIILQGRITAETLVWREQMEDWVKAADSELAPLFSEENLIPLAPKAIKENTPSLSESCANCNRKFSINDLVDIDGNQICAECKPVFIRKMQEGGSVNSVYYLYAGFWIRALAIFLDGLILMTIQLPLAILFGVLIATVGRNSDGGQNIAMVLMFQAINMLVSIVVPLIYNVWFLTKKSATPGKMALGLKVINANGTEKISFGKAIGRHFAKMLNGFTLNIGYMMAGWDEEKRGLHDRICATRVIYKK